MKNKDLISRSALLEYISKCEIRTAGECAGTIKPIIDDVFSKVQATFVDVIRNFSGGNGGKQ